MAYTTAQLVTAYTNANLGKAPDAATTLTLDAYATQSSTGGISDATALANTLKLVNSTTAVAVETYQFFTGVAPSAAGLAYLVNSTTNTADLNDAYYAKFGQENRFINFSINLATGAGAGATAFAAAYGSVTYAQTVATAYDKIIGNATAAAAGVDVAAAVAYLSRADNITYLTNFVKANTGLTAAADIDLAVKAALIGEILNAATVSGLGGYATATTALITDLSDGVLSTDNSAGINLFTAYPSSGAVGKTLVLTTGADVGAAFLGTSGNDTYTAAEATGGASVVTVGDSIDGGAGVDTLNITQTAAFAMPVGATISNIEVINLTTGTTNNVIDTSGWAGVTTLNVVGTGQQTVTAGATTNVTVGRVASTSALQVTGGSNVTVTETGATGSTTKITGAAGVATVNSTIATADGSTGNAITVTGGASIVVNQKGANAVNTTVTDGAVVVNGGATTTTVSVTEAAAATASATKVGHVNGAVTITDANAASLTAAGTITTVTLAGGFAAATVNSGALATLNLSGTGTSVDASTLGALTTAAISSLAVNLTGLKLTGALSVDADIKTLNVASTTASSTIASLSSSATALNISGDKAVTFTAQTLGSTATITSTNTAGVTLGSTLATGQTFTGGAGADTISVASGWTKAITTGAGNDFVTYNGAAGTGGTIVAGDGTDTVSMTAANALTASSDATFNTSVSGFEVLDVLTGGAAQSINLAGINGVQSVVTRGSTNITLTGYNSGGSLTIDGASTNVNVAVTNASLSSTDVFNVTVKGASSVAAGTVTVANVETINVTATDTDTTAANAHTLTIVDADATKITVAGNTGITLANTGAVAVATFDASAHTGDVNNAAGVTYISAYTGTSTTSITGGAGNDTLTGSAAKDVIIGGAGDDTIRGAGGVDTVTGGAGSDTFVFANGDAGITGTDKITDYTTGTGGDILDLATTTLIANNSAGVSVIAAVGGAVDLTATVKNGVITLSGADVALVDTIGEIKAIFELLDLDNTAEVGAIQMGGNTYVLVDTASGGGADTTSDIIQLTGVTGITALGGTAGAHTVVIS